MSCLREKILEVKGLTKKYGTYTAVNELSLEVLQGEVFGLLGPNGAGKTTTIDCILGTKPYDDGKISLWGRNPKKDRKKLFQEIGVQFQASYYPERIKVRELFELTVSLYKRKLEWKPLLEEFSLNGKAESFVGDLSGGERQKLSVALALLNRPGMVFLDELTTGLDPKARRAVWKYLKELNNRGLTIFLTSHYMDEVAKLCDRILIIDKGKKIMEGTPDSIVKASGKEDLEEAYLYFTDEEENINENFEGVV